MFVLKNKSLYHWLVVAACSGLAMAAIGISINCAGIFFTSVSETLGIGRGAVSMTVTLTNVITGLMGPFVASRLIGKVNIKLLTGAGAVVTALCFVGMSAAGHIAFFYLLGAVMGIAITGYSNVVITYIIGNWFQEKNGFAMGITMSCSGLGGAIFNPVLNAAIEAFGWRAAYLAAAGFVLVLTLPGILFIIREHPEEKGLLPYGASCSMAQPAGQKTEKLRVSFGSAAFLVAAAFSVLAYAVSGFNAHVSGFATSIGLSASVGALMVSASMIGNVLFKLLIGVLSDAFGAPKACGVMMLMNIIGMTVFCFLPVGGSVVPMISAFLFGGIYAVAAVGIPLVVRYVYGPRLHSVAYSYISLFACISSSCTMAAFGYSYDIFGTYRVGIAASVVLGICVLVITCFLKRVRTDEAVGR
ncbi:MAG: MFS transporter [Hominenteromicrobium sp.]